MAVPKSDFDIKGKSRRKYYDALKKNSAFWLLEDNHLVMRDCDKDGNLTRSAVVISPKTFSSFEDQTKLEMTLTCSCKEANSEKD